MYDDHFRLITKRVGDFLLVLIELFSLSYAAEMLRANFCSNSSISLQRGPVDRPKISGRRGCPHQPFFSQKTRLNVLSYGMKVCTDFSFVLSQSTCLTVRRTDRILIARPHLHSMQCSKNALHVSAPEQKMFRDWTEATLFRPGTVPVPVLVLSLNTSMCLSALSACYTDE